jgi:hypothetical protein
MQADNKDPFAADDAFNNAAIAADTQAWAEAADDPFSGKAAVSNADYDEYEMPETPIGVLAGFVKTAKTQEVTKDGVTVKNLILEIECTDPKFSGAATVSLWLKLTSGGKTDPKTMPRAVRVAQALGLPASLGKPLRLPKAEAYLNRPGLFVYSTYIDKQSGGEQATIAWGLPKPGDSASWDAWFSEANLTEDQIKKLKGSPGVLPLNSF